MHAIVLQRTEKTSIPFPFKGYNHGDRFPFNFEPNGLPFGSKSKGKLPTQPYPIRFERKWKCSFLSAEMDWNNLLTEKEIFSLGLD